MNVSWMSAQLGQNTFVHISLLLLAFSLLKEFLYIFTS